MENSVARVSSVLAHRGHNVGEIDFITFDIDHSSLNVTSDGDVFTFVVVDRKDIAEAIILDMLADGAKVRHSDYDTTLILLVGEK